MLQIRRYELAGNFSHSTLALLLSELKGNFVPILNTIKREFWTKLGLQAAEQIPTLPNPEVAGGELYLTKSGDFLYFKIASAWNLLECGSIQKEEENPDFNSFFETIKNLLAQELKTKELHWKALTQEEKFNLLAAKKSFSKPTKVELGAAKALEDPLLHKALSRIQSSSLSSIRDLMSGEDRSKMEPIIDSLIRLGLLTKDFVVLCKEKGQQIIKVSSRQAILETSEKGLKCFLCGKPISEEPVEEVLSITDLGKKMIEKNYWMLISILEMLSKFIPREHLALDRDDEIPTVYFSAFGEIIPIFLIDRKLSITDSYSINAKLSLYESKTAILLATSGISQIVNEFIRGSNPNCLLHFFESMNGFEEKIEQILKSRQQQKLQEVLASFTPLTAVPLRDLVCQKLFSEDEARKGIPVTSGIKRSRGGKEEVS